MLGCTLYQTERVLDALTIDPSAATSTRCSLMWMPSICTTMMSSSDRSALIHALMCAADNATKCREAADFDYADIVDQALMTHL